MQTPPPSRLTPSTSTDNFGRAPTNAPPGDDLDDSGDNSNMHEDAELLLKTPQAAQSATQQQQPPIVINATTAAAAAAAHSPTAPSPPNPNNPTAKAAPGVESQTDIRLGEWLLKDASVSRSMYLELHTMLRKERMQHLREVSNLRQALTRLEAEKHLASTRGAAAQLGSGFTKARPKTTTTQQQQQQLQSTVSHLDGTVIITAAADLNSPLGRATTTMTTADLLSGTLSVGGMGVPANSAVSATTGSSTSGITPTTASATNERPAGSHLAMTTGSSMMQSMNDAARALSALTTLEAMEERHAAEITALRQQFTEEAEEVRKTYASKESDLKSELAVLRVESVAASRAGALERERLVHMMERSAFESVQSLKNHLKNLQGELEEARNTIAALRGERTEMRRELDQLRAEKIRSQAEAAKRRIVQNNNNNNASGSQQQQQQDALQITDGSEKQVEHHQQNALLICSPTPPALSLTARGGRPGTASSNRGLLQQREQQEQHQQMQAAQTARTWLREARQEIAAQSDAGLAPMAASAKKGTLLMKPGRRKTSVSLHRNDFNATHGQRSSAEVAAANRSNALELVMNEKEV